MLSIARPDKIIASIVDSATDQCVQTTVTDRFVAEDFRGIIGRPENAPPTTATKRNQAFRTRGGHKPLDSVQRFQSYLPMAVSPLMSCFSDEYKFEYADRGLSQDELRFIGRDTNSSVAGLSLTTANDNHSRQHTLSIRYPANGRFYISYTNHSLADFICDWIGVVNDCYILHAMLSKSHFFHLTVHKFRSL